MAEHKSIYRGENVRLTKPVSPLIVETCYPGPGKEINGRYAELRQKLKAFHAFDKAHLVMLYEQGHVTREEARKMFGVFRDIEAEGMEDVRDDTHENMHSGEYLLTSRLGKEIGGKLHLGRSSGDLTALGNLFTMLRRETKLLEKFNEFREALLKKAEENIDTVMPAYTHGQHAQPMTFAHYLLSLVCKFDRDFDRLRCFFERYDENPAGAAIISGSEFHLDQKRTAELLGFSRVSKNTLDAVWGRDWHLEAQADLTILFANIAQMSEDLYVWSTSEFNLVEFADALCGTSSIMPQKKNCHAVQYLRGLSGIGAKYFVENVYVFKNPTGAPVMDGQRIMDDLWRGYDEATVAMPLATEMIDTLTVNKDVMVERAGHYWATATDLAGEMVKEFDLPWRFAHQIVGTTVRIAIERQVLPLELTQDIVDEAAVLATGKPLGMTTENIRKALNPVNAVNNHDMIGGPAPVRIREELAEHWAVLEKDKEWLAAKQQQHKVAADKLEQAIDAILAD